MFFMTLDWHRSLFGGKFSADSLLILSFLKVIYSARKLSSNFRSNFLQLCPYSYANFHFLTLVLSDWVEFVKCLSKKQNYRMMKIENHTIIFFQSQVLIISNFSHIQTKLQHSTLSCKLSSLKNRKINNFMLQISARVDEILKWMWNRDKNCIISIFSYVIIRWSFS